MTKRRTYLTDGTPPTPEEKRKAERARRKALADFDRQQKYGLGRPWAEVHARVQKESGRGTR